MMPRITWFVLLWGALGCRHSSGDRPAQPPLGEVWLTEAQVKEAKLEVVTVSDQDVSGAVVAAGKITFDDLHVSHLFSPVAGRVIKILAQLGQRVKKDDALAIIDSPDVGSAFSDLGKAHAELIAAEHELRRQKDLFEAHAGSQKDYEAAQFGFQKAKAELDRARAKARLFRGGQGDRVSQEYTLRSPIDGEVVARNVNLGAEVQGQYSSGSAVELYTIGELDPIWAVADIFEMDLARVKHDSSAQVKVIAYPNRTFAGEVEWISDTLDPVSRTAKVRCVVKNPDRELKPEMYATISISVPGARELAIPRPAMLRLGDQTVVFVELGKTPTGLDRFERRPVAVREGEGGEFLPVTHGVSRGDHVVSSGAILLSGML